MRGIITSLLIFAGAACGGVLEPNEISLRLAGTVTGQATGQPIAGAEILLFEERLLSLTRVETTVLATVVTDSQGRYSLAASYDSRCPNSLSFLGVSASASGFRPVAKAATRPECTGAVQRFDFVLEAS